MCVSKCVPVGVCMWVYIRWIVWAFCFVILALFFGYLPMCVCTCVCVVCV